MLWFGGFSGSGRPPGRARLRAAGAPSPALRWAASYVLNRAGEEVPAALHLRAFDENGQRLLGVALRRRDEGE